MRIGGFFSNLLGRSVGVARAGLDRGRFLFNVVDSNGISSMREGEGEGGIFFYVHEKINS